MPIKTTSITGLRKVLYSQIDQVVSGNADYKKANSVTQSAQSILNSYKIQLTAMKMAGKIEPEKLEGLLD